LEHTVPHMGERISHGLYVASLVVLGARLKGREDPGVSRAGGSAAVDGYAIHHRRSRVRRYGAVAGLKSHHWVVAHGAQRAEAWEVTPGALGVHAADAHAEGLRAAGP